MLTGGNFYREIMINRGMILIKKFISVKRQKDIPSDIVISLYSERLQYP